MSDIWRGMGMIFRGPVFIPKTYVIHIEGAGTYPGSVYNMEVELGDFLLGIDNARGGVGITANGNYVDGSSSVDFDAPGKINIVASTNYDTAGASRRAGRSDYGFADATDTFVLEAVNDSHAITIINFKDELTGAPVQVNSDAADADDNCDISLVSAPSGIVIVAIAYGGSTDPSGGKDLLSVPPGWNRVMDEQYPGGAGMGVVVFQGTSQNFVFSLPTGYTTNGGRLVMIMEF